MYNFYNDVLNRAVESYWRAGEARKAFSEGDYDRFKKHAGAAAAGVFASVFWPAVVHNFIDPPQNHPDDPGWLKGLRYVVHPTAGLFPIVRDMANFFTGSDSPDVGLLTAAYKQLEQFPKEIITDLAHGRTLSPASKERLFKDGGTWLGALTGPPLKKPGEWAGAAYGLATGQEHIQGPVSAHDLVRFGTTRGHARTLQEYVQGQYDRRR
jgi:hypothetical protein